MSDFVISQIRTYVPIIVGAVLAFLTTKGIELDATAAAGLSTFLTALFGGLWYLIGRLLERKWPELGILLGVAKKPNYK